MAEQSRDQFLLNELVRQRNEALDLLAVARADLGLAQAKLAAPDGAALREAEPKASAAIEPPTDDVLAINDAVRKLEAQDSRKGMIVNLRYFAGFSAEETARALGLSLGTIEREWRFIKAWLREELEEARDCS